MGKFCMEEKRGEVCYLTAGFIWSLRNRREVCLNIDSVQVCDALRFIMVAFLHTVQITVNVTGQCPMILKIVIEESYNFCCPSGAALKSQTTYITTHSLTWPRMIQSESIWILVNFYKGQYFNIWSRQLISTSYSFWTKMVKYNLELKPYLKRTMG